MAASFPRSYRSRQSRSRGFPGRFLVGFLSALGTGVSGRYSVSWSLLGFRVGLQYSFFYNFFQLVLRVASIRSRSRSQSCVTLVPDIRLQNTQWYEIIGAGETVWMLRVPTSPPGEHSTVWRNPGTWRLPHVYHCAKNSAGFPNSCWKTPTR